MSSFWYSYLPQCSTIVQNCLSPGDKYIWWYSIFKSKDDAYVKLSRFSSISCILGNGNGFLRILWFSFIKLDKNIIILFFFGVIKVGFLTLNKWPFLVPLYGKTVIIPYGKRPHPLEAPIMDLMIRFGSWLYFYVYRFHFSGSYSYFEKVIHNS